MGLQSEEVIHHELRSNPKGKVRSSAMAMQCNLTVGRNDDAGSMTSLLSLPLAIGESARAGRTHTTSHLFVSCFRLSRLPDDLLIR
jgi:hypothetical protein